jgi:hypothetical protein
LERKKERYFLQRLIACGCQDPVFDERFAPFINDVSLRILLIAKLLCDMKAKVSTLKQLVFMEIHMDMPPFLSINSNQNLILCKTIYSLVKIAREFYKKLIEI